MMLLLALICIIISLFFVKRDREEDDLEHIAFSVHFAGVGFILLAVIFYIIYFIR